MRVVKTKFFRRNKINEVSINFCFKVTVHSKIRNNLYDILIIVKGGFVIKNNFLHEFIKKYHCITASIEH